MRRHVIFLVLNFSLVLGPAGPPRLLSSRKKVNHQKFNLQRLKMGTFIYRELSKGVVDGRGEITIEPKPGSDTFRISDIESGQFSQRWEAVITKEVAPISATLSFGETAG